MCCRTVYGCYCKLFCKCCTCGKRLDCCAVVCCSVCPHAERSNSKCAVFASNCFRFKEILKKICIINSKYAACYELAEEYALIFCDRAFILTAYNRYVICAYYCYCDSLRSCSIKRYYSECFFQLRPFREVLNSIIVEVISPVAVLIYTESAVSAGCIFLRTEEAFICIDISYVKLAGC